MGILYISEYDSIHSTNVGDDPQTGGATAQAVKEPSLTTQAITFSTVEPSAEFSASTRLIRVVSDTQCYIKIGPNPTAVTVDSMLMPAFGVEYFGVNPGDKLSVIE